MRNASGSLIALLNNSTEILVADLLTVTDIHLNPNYATSADHDVTCVSQVDSGSHLFPCGMPFTRGATKLVTGLEVSTMELTVYPRPQDLFSGVPWQQAAITGLLDEARVVLERAYLAKFTDTSAGTLIVFSGRVGQVDVTRTTVKIQVRSDLELLQALMPRNLYQPGCLHTLYDSGCTLNPVSFTTSAVVAGGTTTSLLNTTSLSGKATGYFDLGYLYFTSGVLNGQVFTVSAFVNAGSPQTVDPVKPFPVAPAPGDNFAIVAGCDKQQSTCSGKFANLAHFRGFPYVPSSETSH